MKYKVLVISNLFPSRKSPYHGSFVKNFVDDLKGSSYVSSVSVCVLKGRNDRVLIKLSKYVWFYVSIFCRLLFRHYDLVYVHLITHASIPIRMVAAVKKLSLIFNIHGEDLLVKTPLAKKLLRIATPLLYEARAIVVPSYYFKRITLGTFPDIPADKVIVSASGGVKDVFYRRKEAKTNPVFTLGYVSRIDRGKGWDTLLTAVGILNEKGIRVHVILVGGGLEADKMRRYAVQNKLYNVDCVGPIAHDDLPRFYRKMDLFVFPTRLEESLGLVGLEAMAAGVPVIASEIGGISDYLRPGENGLFFTPGDQADLADKIDRFLNFPQSIRDSMSENAYATAEKYRATAVSSALFAAIFQNIMK